MIWPTTTPYDPRLTCDPTKNIEGLKLMYIYVFLCSRYLLCMSYNIFSENELLTPVTPNDPGWTSRPITFVEGI